MHTGLTLKWCCQAEQSDDWQEEAHGGEWE